MGFEIENLVQERIASFGGIKSAFPHGVLNPGDAEDILNFVTRRGRLRKIWGTGLYFNSGFGAGEISWLESFRDRWMAQHGTAIIRELTEGHADFQQIGSLILGDSYRAHSEKWENRIYLANGVESRYLEDPGPVAFVPDGDFLRLGLFPPGLGARNFDGSGVFQPAFGFTEVQTGVTPQIPYAGVAWATAVGLPANTVAAGPAGTGEGDTLTANANGFLVIDSNLVSIGDRVLVKNEGTGPSNGIYVVTVVGDAATPWVLTRAPDFNTAANIVNGATSLVAGGLLNGGATFQGTFAGAFIIGTTVIVFAAVLSNPSPLGAGKNFGYVFTWWDANRQVESLPWGAQVGEDGLWKSFALAFGSSNAFVMSQNGYSNKLDFTEAKAFGYDRQRVTHFIPYRWTQADNATFKRIADPNDEAQEESLRIENDTYTDITPESELGAVLDESLSPPPSGLLYGGKGNIDLDQASIGPRFLKFFRDQLWLFGVRYPGTANGVKLQPNGTSAKQAPYQKQDGIAYASQVGNHEYWQFSYDIGRASGQRDSGIGQHNSTLMFFKERSTYYLTGTNPSNYQIRTLDPSRGFTIPGSIADTTKGTMGISADGFASFDGVGLGVVISDEINDLFLRINLDAFDKIYATFDPKEEKYECHVPLDKFTWNTHVFSYDCKLQCWEITQKVGASAAYAISSKKKVVSMIGDARNGRIYDAGDYSRTTLNGQTIFGKWRSKAFDFSQPGKLKGVQIVEVTARALRDFTLTCDLVVDFGEDDAANATGTQGPDIRSDLLGANANDEQAMAWDEGQWSKASNKRKFTFLIQAIGKNFNVILRNSDKDANTASFEIEEVIVHASLLTGNEED